MVLEKQGTYLKESVLWLLQEIAVLDRSHHENSV